MLCSVLLRRLGAAGADETLQCPLSLHRQFGPEHHGRSATRALGQRAVQGVQRRQLSQGCCSPISARPSRKRRSRYARPAQQELGRVRRTGGVGNGLRLHRLRPGRGRGLPDLARQSGDRSLGCGGPGRRRGYAGGEAQGFSRSLSGARNRIKLFTSLRLEALNRLAVKRNVDEIGLRTVASREPTS